MLQTVLPAQPSEAVSSDSGSAEALSFPASLAQQAFWFLEQLEPGSTAFNVAVRFHLAGALDVAILERAFNALIQRHEILRTHFEEEAGQLLQIVLPFLEIKLDVIDISSVPESERKAELDRQGSIEAQKPFALERAPLIRANVVRISQNEHVLQVTIHHAVCDGWSIGVLTDDIAAFYEAFASGASPSLPDLPVQFADYTIWQQDFLRGPEIAAQLDYWKKRLDGYVELDLPTDRQRPVVKQWEGDIVSILLPTDLTSRLQTLSQRHGATIFMAFVAAFKVLLLRYTGQEKIAIGSPVVGRTRVEIEKLIGVFINTVVLHTDLSGNPTFSKTLDAVRETVVEAMANQDLPFEMLVKELQPARDLSRNPLFQVNFIHQRDFVKPVKFAGLTLTAVPSRSPGAIFDLQFFMVERDGVWRASCEYNTALYARETALRMLGNFQQILASAVENPNLPIENLEILPPEERKQLVFGWNNTQRDYPVDKTIHELFAEQAKANPAKVAVRCGKRSVTYAELDQAANRLSGTLRASGVKPGVMVGLCVERSVEMVVGVLGILKAGGAYVPMDPNFPAERLAWMLEDTQMPVIVTQNSLASKLPPHQAQAVLLDNLPSEVTEPLSVSGSSAKDLAYVIFTSGSTGRPKGVQIPHRAVVNFLNSMRREPGMDASDVLLSVTTLSFDIAGLELFLPLTTGATVAIATREVATDANILIEELERIQATVMQATPITWRMMIEAGWQGSSRLKALVGGEAVSRELVNKLAPRCGSLWNMYGPTETTIWSAVGRLEAGQGPVKIGKPIDNTQIYVVARQKKTLQPVGVAGELLIGGDGLALGYLNRPELSAEKFIPDPFSKRPGARLYRTGDLARWHPDGTLECLQRMDDQVKIRGYRIELGEVESAIAKDPDIRQAVVVARDDVAGAKRLVAYVVPDEGKSPNPSALRDRARATLPDYMVPSVFVVLQKLPLTPNGKIDRKSLPSPDSGAASDSTVFEKPRNETERKLLEIFSKALRTNVTSTHDNFFDLGGHSLLAVALMSSIEREFGKKIPLARLLSAPTVARLAVHIDAPVSEGKPKWHALMPIQPREGKPRFFLVHGAGGNILLYRELAEALGPEISVYGFQSLGLDSETKPLTTIEEMAAYYVKELRAFQPQGPYHFGGYCMGGAVAYDMARLLTEAGQQVGLVALLDSYNQSTVRDRRGTWSGFCTAFEKARFHASNLTSLNSKDLRSYVSEKYRLLNELFRDFVASFNLRKSEAATGKSVVSRIQKINHESAWTFTPKASGAPITLFRPRNNYSIFSDLQSGWSVAAKGRVDVVTLGDNPHVMLIQPAVATLAAELRERILKSRN